MISTPCQTKGKEIVVKVADILEIANEEARRLYEFYR